jgi:2-C-methyl-D-erythritol 4-phosphate cytidylyltransferase
MANNLRVVIAAAGKGSRMKSNINKQYMSINGSPVLAYSLSFFEQLKMVDKIVVVTGEGEQEFCQKEIITKFKFNKTSIVPGGKERQDSVWAGLKTLGEDTDLVAVHDGARPLLSLDVFTKLLAEADKWGAAIPGITCKDTLKMVDRDGFVRKTMDRDSVFAIQTPQVFKFNELVIAYQQAYEEGFRATDDASLFENYIGRVKVVQGDYNNIKITTPEDISIAEALLRR